MFDRVLLPLQRSVLQNSTVYILDRPGNVWSCILLCIRDTIIGLYQVQKRSYLPRYTQVLWWCHNMGFTHYWPFTVGVALTNSQPIFGALIFKLLLVEQCVGKDKELLGWWFDTPLSPWDATEMSIRDIIKRMLNTAGCCYNAVQYDIIVHTVQP